MAVSSIGAVALLYVLIDLYMAIESTLLREQWGALTIFVAAELFVLFLLFMAIVIFILLLFEAKKVKIINDVVEVNFAFLPKISFSRTTKLSNRTVRDFAFDPSSNYKNMGILFFRGATFFVVSNRTTIYPVNALAEMGCEVELVSPGSDQVK